mmetsp:Transcript_2418/g.5162  ORF Transcript_2418/g.5162 Transcript_2418/m.5162 type:complete len:549 (+) Transcript_2418:85-1731(+)
MGCTQGHVAIPGNGDNFTEVISPKGQSFADHFSLGKVLGHGAFAEVRVALATNPKDEAYGSVAVKIMDLQNKKLQGKRTSNPSSDSINRAKREVSVWKRVSSAQKACFVNLHEVFWDSTCIYFLMERCDMSCLAYLERAEKLDELVLARMFQQVALGIATLHSLQVSHRDIKPDNFLINKGGQTKLADFGLATVFNGQHRMTQAYGTPPYMSPEMLSDGQYCCKTDVWSIGVTMYVLIFGSFPYQGTSKTAKAMKQAIREGMMPPDFAPWAGAEKGAEPSRALVSLVRQLLSRDPESRPSAAEVLANPYWFSLTQKADTANQLQSFRSLLKGAKRAGAFSLPSKKSPPPQPQEEKPVRAPTKESRVTVGAEPLPILRRVGSLSSVGSMDSMGSMASAATLPPRYMAQMNSMNSMSSCGSSVADVSPKYDVSGSPNRRASRTSWDASPRAMAARQQEEGFSATGWNKTETTQASGATTTTTAFRPSPSTSKGPSSQRTSSASTNVVTSTSGGLSAVAAAVSMPGPKGKEDVVAFTSQSSSTSCSSMDVV